MPQSLRIHGKCAVPGIVTGVVRFINNDSAQRLESYLPGSAEQENRRFLQARQAALQKSQQIIQNLQNKGNEEQAEILESRNMILSDSVLESEVLAKVENGIPAPKAVLEASGELAAQIAGLDDPYLRERSVDIENAGREIAGILLGNPNSEPSKGPGILCGEEIDPSVIAESENGEITGLVIGSASVTSHAVIIAKSRGIPTIVGIENIEKRFPDHVSAILDGNDGLVVIDPDDRTYMYYREKMNAEAAQKHYYESLTALPAVTRDGFRVTLAANVGKPHEIDAASQYGCEGVGLFRTEFLFMGRDSMPTEQEQFEAYRYVIEKCGGECVIRTMDIGGDKPLPYLQVSPEKNPFLGWRAIRISLERTDLFITQIRAILRASQFGKTAVMLPFISGIEEIRQARQMIRGCMEELKNEGVSFDASIPVGIMVETPAAVMMAPEFASECDFFSIGTNDLTQYTLAADRGNAKLGSLYSFYHPAVLRSIALVIQAAHDHGIKAAMCGEMAGDPRAAEFLCSLGIDELSMSPVSIPKVKDAVRGLEKNSEFVKQMLSLRSTAEIEALLKRQSENVSQR